jgi:hypothetical protein
MNRAGCASPHDGLLVFGCHCCGFLHRAGHQGTRSPAARSTEEAHAPQSPRDPPADRREDSPRIYPLEPASGVV